VPVADDPLQQLTGALSDLDVAWGKYRYPTYGGTGIYSGGEYDNFRRSSDIEDRRRQTYAANPGGEDNSPAPSVLELFSNYGAERLQELSPLSHDLGIDDVNLYGLLSQGAFENSRR
jgi:hypothetical protein